MSRTYYLLSVLILLAAFLLFAWKFERKRPRTREVILISVLSALAVAGRVLFFMIPQFKPMAALIIITALCCGKETGFLVGTVSALVSNFFFGQGPWTPWQMMAFGLIGYVTGMLFHKKQKKVSRQILCIYGFFVVLLLYGGIMNPASLLMYSGRVTWPSVLAVYASGLPFDLIHAGSTAIFLWLLSDAMRDKLDRIRKKYGLLG